MTPNEKNTFIGALKNGFGLTKAAGFILKTPQEMSELVRGDPALHKQCEEAIKTAATALIAMTTENLIKRRFEKWKGNMQFAKSFVTALNFWQSYCKREEVNPVRVAMACVIYKDMDEVATVTGMTRAELTEYMVANPTIQEYLAQVQGTG